MMKPLFVLLALLLLSGCKVEQTAGTSAENCYLCGGRIDNGFSAKLLIDYDNGHAMGPLRFYNDRKQDAEQLASFLCEDCLNEIFYSKWLIISKKP
ncbi:hypothetical protein [uncultured Oscillibacter sp.]|uniref:hypothetical protein n=1 Tax=uncultured Oscillibacter sp. TaxID=876091 RepID=UPI00260E9C31|nr:hypothetical protein [uncultured Oscillibacter sp.]